MLEIQQMNEMAVHLLNVQGYKGKVLEVFIEKVGQTQHLTKPFTQERIESLAKTNTHGARINGSLPSTMATPAHFGCHFD